MCVVYVHRHSLGNMDLHFSGENDYLMRKDHQKPHVASHYKENLTSFFFFNSIIIYNNCFVVTDESSWTFFREIDKKLLWIIEAINEASATNSMMNLSRTLYVIADAKNTLLYSLKFRKYSNKKLLGSNVHPTPTPQLH